VVGCTVKQGSLCGHRLEKFHNCIAYSSRRAKRSNAARAAQESRKMGTAGRVPTNKAMHTAMGIYRVVLGHRSWGGGAAAARRVEQDDAEEQDATVKASEVMMTEAEIATTNATEPDPGSLAPND